MKKQYDNPPDLPYEENDESFGNWFREKAKEKWQKYLNGDEKGISIQDCDTMRSFLIDHGTPEEIQTRLDSLLDKSIPAYEILLEVIQKKYPNFKPKSYDLELE